MKKILVIDDTKNIRLMLTKCLELEGYHVTTASDGKEAIEQFKNHTFDLAFLDIKLPEIRGTEVLKRIREMGIDTPVIIITAYGTVKNAVDCTHLGAVAYVQKPFTADKIRSVLAEFYGRKRNEDSVNNSLETAIHRIQELISSNSFTEALQLLKKVFSIDTEKPELFLLISQAYRGLGNLDYAEKYYKTYELFKN